MKPLIREVRLYASSRITSQYFVHATAKILKWQSHSIESEYKQKWILNIKSLSRGVYVAEDTSSATLIAWFQEVQKGAIEFIRTQIILTNAFEGESMREGISPTQSIVQDIIHEAQLLRPFNFYTKYMRNIENSKKWYTKKKLTWNNK